MKNKHTLLAVLALAAPLLAVDPISGPLINAIHGSQENSSAGDSLKARLEENVHSLFAYREAGQSRHPDILAALGLGVQLLSAQYDQREAAATLPEQLDSLQAGRAHLVGYQRLLDSLVQTP